MANLESPADREHSSASGQEATNKTTLPRRLFWGVLWLVLGVAAIYEVRAEIGRWQTAYNLETMGDEVYYDQTLKENPNDFETLARRALLHQKKERPQKALDDWNRVLKKNPNDVTILAIRAQLLQKLGRPKEAVDDWDRILEIIEDAGGRPNAVMRNNRAYSRALANIEIDKGLEDVEIALQEIAEKPSYDRATYLDTRGYLYFLRGKDSDLKHAESDLNEALEMIDTLREQRGVPIPESSLAVIYHHRGEVYEKLGKEEQAKGDFELAEQYHYEPEVGTPK